MQSIEASNINVGPTLQTRSGDAPPTGIHQNPQILLQARPVDKFRNDQNIRFGQAGESSHNDRGAAGPSQDDHNRVVAFSTLYNGNVGSENAHQKTAAVSIVPQ